MRSHRILLVFVVVEVLGVLAVVGVGLTSWGSTLEGGPFDLEGLILLGVLLAVGLPIPAVVVFSVRRDQYFDVPVPGLVPPGSPTVRTGRRRVVVPVRFSPPDGMRPAEVGLAHARDVRSRHVAATLVDLARRGHLDLTPTSQGWLLAPGTTGTDALAAHEGVLLEGLFRDGPAVTTRELAGRSQELLHRVRLALGGDAFRRGWLRSDPVRGDRATLLFATVLAGLGLHAAVGQLSREVDPGAGYAAVGWLVVAAAFATCVLVPVGRTALGTVMAQQAAGFERYLATAEAGQLRSEEAAGLLPTYLAHAVALGLTDRWRGVIDDIATGRDHTSSWVASIDAVTSVLARPGEE